jgi:hypothetical protein
VAGKGDAEITVGCDSDAVQRAASAAKAAWRDAGQAITSAIGSTARQVIGDLAGVATAMGKVSFSSQHQQVREFESVTAHLAVATGRDLESVRSEYEATGKAIGKRPAEIAAWATEVGKLTGNFRGAGDAIKGLSGLAAETNRSVDDYRGLAVELGTVGHIAGDTTHAVGVLAAQADALGTVGGVAAFSGQVEALGDTISHFAGKSEADFLKVTAAAAVLGKGLSDAASKRVQSSALGAVAADPVGWSRFLGHEITDEHGQVKDPVHVLQEITDKVKRRFGSRSRRVLQQNFGSEAGAALYNADFSEAAHAAGLAPSKKPAEAQQAMNATDAGKRDVSQAELAASSRALLGSSTALGQAADKLQQFAAHNPITGTFVATALSTGAGAFMANFGKSIATMMGGRGAGGAVGGLVDLAKGTGAGAVLGKLGIAGAIAGAGVYGIEKFDEAAQERHKLEEHARDVGAQGALNNKLIAVRRTNAALHRLDGLTGEERGKAINAASAVTSGKDAMAALKFSHGGDEALRELIAELKKRGEKDGKEAEKIAKAVAEAMRNVKIVNGTGGPIEVVGAQSSSAAAGDQ